jgi:ribonuclease E
MPTCEKLVKLHKEKRPIFSRFQLEEQIDQIYEKRVPLPSGGSLIIEPTEALVSIDVNSGKSSGERGIEDTAFKTNMEAAEEVARQLRLRDLGGLIVIDFIDMRENKHNHDVEKTLKQALKMDKARVNLGRISEFGMLEMSRQRIAKTLNDAIHLECPHCEGRGKVKSVEAMALSFLRKVHGAAAKGIVSEVHGGLPLEVAYYLLNRKKRELTQIENDYEIEVTVKGKTSYLLNQLELETVKREKPRAEDVAKSDAESDEAPAPRPRFETVAPEESGSGPAVEESAPAEGGKKRKRRRKKKKGGADALVTPHEGETAVPVDERAAEQDLAQEPAGGEEHASAADELGGKPKKRRRRRGRKGAKGVDEGLIAEPASPVPPAAESVPAAAVAADEPKHKPEEEADSAKEKPKRVRAPRAKKTVEAPPVPAKTIAAEPAAEAVVAAKKPRRPAASKAPKPVPEAAEAPAAPPVVPPKRAVRPRRPKKIEEKQ